MPHEAAGFCRVIDGRGIVRHVNVLTPRSWGSVRPEWQLPLTAWFFFMALASLACIGFSLSQYRQGGWSFLLPLVLGGMLVARSGRWLPAWARGYPARAASRLIEQSRCPTCLYEIDRLTPERDGCVVCPECGGAWRIPDTSHAD